MKTLKDTDSFDRKPVRFGGCLVVVPSEINAPETLCGLIFATEW